MLRLIGFFVLVVLLTSVLGELPVIGGLFRRTGCIGIWITAIGLSWFLSWWGERALRIGRDRARVRELLAVDNPHNRGKLGSLLLGQGRAQKALVHLEVAAEGEPDAPEWHYRLGCALLEVGRGQEAVQALEACVALDEEYAYGAAQMRYAEALAGAGRHEDALAALATQERNHGPTPESAFRRGKSHKALGDREQARAAFAEVGRLASGVAGYQRREASAWVARARLASWF